MEDRRQLRGTTGFRAIPGNWWGFNQFHRIGILGVCCGCSPGPLATNRKIHKGSAGGLRKRVVIIAPIRARRDYARILTVNPMTAPSYYDRNRDALLATYKLGLLVGYLEGIGSERGSA